MSVFNVANFLAQWDSTAAPAVQVSKPRQVHCWTKTSKDEGGQFCFGDESGKQGKAMQGGLASLQLTCSCKSNRCMTLLCGVSML